jgi:hypothetical protein
MVRQSPDQSRERLHASLALLPVDPSQVDYLFRQLVESSPSQFPVLRDSLSEHQVELVQPLWQMMESTDEPKTRRFRAACALAEYETKGNSAEGRDWRPNLPLVADQLIETIGEAPVHYPTWLQALNPIRDQLRAPLTVVYRNADRYASDRDLAASILADIGKDRPDQLIDLVADADARQFRMFWEKLREHDDDILGPLTLQMGQARPPGASDEIVESVARRQANLAMVLLRLGRVQDVWPLLQHSRDPRRRT